MQGAHWMPYAGFAAEKKWRATFACMQKNKPINFFLSFKICTFMPLYSARFPVTVFRVLFYI
jgi:hypothetical protein